MTSEDKMQGKKEVEIEIPGGIIARLIAQLVDVLITVLILVAVTHLIGLLTVADKDVQSAREGMLFFGLLLSWMILPIAYYGYCYKRFGATLGKRLFGLRVKDRASGDNIGYAQTVVREVIGKWIIGLGLPSLFLMVIRKDRRAVHDFLGRTIVVAKQ